MTVVALTMAERMSRCVGDEERVDVGIRDGDVSLVEHEEETGEDADGELFIDP